MKKVCLLMFVAINATTLSFSSNENDKEPKRAPVPGKITMTTSGDSRMAVFILNQGNEKDVVNISGTATIDWGDGSAIEKVEFSENGLKLSYEYSDTTDYTITITCTDLTGFAKSGKRPVTSLDVSKAPGLVSLELGGYVEVDRIQKKIAMYSVSHQLTELDVSKNMALTYLKVEHTQLTELDVNKNKALKVLDVADNQLTELDVSKNTALTFLKISDTQLTELDVSKNTELKFLLVDGNQLTGMDVANNTALAQLIINDNQLDAAALNALFRTLHDYHLNSGVEMTFPGHLIGYRKIIEIGGNPGSEDCDPKIANDKGWGVKLDH